MGTVEPLFRKPAADPRPPLPPEMFQRAVKALYGDENWLSKFQAAHSIPLLTAVGYAQGIVPIPAEIEGRIARALNDRGRELLNLWAQISDRTLASR